MIYLPIIFFEICSILCLFAPFTFVFCLISAIKKASSDTGNELLNGFFRRWKRVFPRSGRRAKPVYHAGRDLLCAFMNAQN